MKSYCSSNKNFYHSESECIEALIESIGNNSNSSSLGPVNVYRCTICHGFHLTSKGEKHAVLDDPIVKEKIAKLKQAAQWNDRF